MVVCSQSQLQQLIENAYLQIKFALYCASVQQFCNLSRQASPKEILTRLVEVAQPGSSQS